MPNHICSNNRFSASSNIGSNTGDKVDQGARLGKTKRATAASAIRGQFLERDFFFGADLVGFLILTHWMAQAARSTINPRALSFEEPLPHSTEHLANSSGLIG